ncbi:energy transducer TonB [Pelagerythrobacter rhizovicinus]|uniref:Energy transducer TonB n=1 Tax=Pelagerythrobacter rhizovicinus TaxID=2268576 RepID=A0A4Q2KJD2_9SPHN|nr:energy transducer TonB [Pelagerythrobacter rhizovicinus]RXZ65324.1 energy transducer TonB [Pelagerythrobacter rhizovicinus]
MASVALSREERLGLGIAVALHVALGVMLLFQPQASDPPPIPERMTVSLAEDVGPVAVAPDPVAESRAAIAPTLSEEPAPAPTAIEPPRPAEIERPAPPERPRPRATSAPRQEAQPRREPTPRRTSQPEQRRTERSGGSRVGSDFLAGSGSSTTTEETRIPASQIGASAKASIIQAIIRQIKPHWSAPQGADADKLVTILSFRLNEDGSLSGAPRVVDQSGITPANRPQAGLHAERAIRAVQLAAPFDLPPEYYNAWRSIDGARFDRNLSQ